jgi:hypothetical protein
LRRLTIRRAGFRQRDILKAAGAAAIELLFARSAPRLGAGGAGVGGDKTFSTCVKRSHGGVGGGWRTSSHITVGHAPTCEVTIFIFRSKFLSYRGRGSPGGSFLATRPSGGGPFSFFAANFYPIEGGARQRAQRMNNFLPGKTSCAPQAYVAKTAADLDNNSIFPMLATLSGAMLASGVGWYLVRPGPRTALS